MAINVHICVCVGASILTGSESAGEGMKFALENTANRDYPENFGAQVEKVKGKAKYILFIKYFQFEIIFFFFFARII